MNTQALRGRISWDGTSTPLKTVLFLVVCAAWLLPGLVGHDPWKVDEAVVFGMVVEMLRTGDALVLRVAGEPFIERAPLLPWVAAAFAKALGGVLALHDAARLASGAFMALSMAFVSLTARELMGDRAVRLSVLLLIGCLGLLIRAHELNTEVAGLAGLSLALYGLAAALRRPAVGGAVTGLGMALSFLGDGLMPLGMVLALLLVLPALLPAWRNRGYALAVAVALLVAVPLVAAWPLALRAASPEAFAQWLAYNGLVGSPAPDMDGLSALYFARILPWYAWPAWPLAAWSLWRCRRSLPERRDLQLPLAAFIAFFLALTVFGDPRGVDAMPLLLPLAILGVAEVDSLPRGAASALDWFGMTTFLLLGVLLWIGWVAALSGKPDFAMAWLQKEIPNFHYRFSVVAFALATMLTLVWLVVVARSLRSTRRAIVNWTAGITMVWMLLMTLGVPLVDQARSYRAVSSRVVEALPASFTCILRRNVGDAQRALLDYFVNLRTVPDHHPQAQACRALLVQASPTRQPAVPPGWVEAWRGSRPGDRNELFILYHR